MKRLSKVLPVVLLFIGMAVTVAACWLYSLQLGLLSVGGCIIGLALIVARGDADG